MTSRTAGPYENQYDPHLAAPKVIKEYEWALMNWDIQPGEWQYHLDRMRDTIEILLDLIEE